jgi:hypothetical protein
MIPNGALNLGFGGGGVRVLGVCCRERLGMARMERSGWDWARGARRWGEWSVPDRSGSRL